MPTTVPSDALDVCADLLGLLTDTTTEPRPDPQLEALSLAVSADLPVLLWGEPGIGKTAALNQLAGTLGLPLTTVIASVHEPADFTGLPVVGDDPAAQGVPMAPPDWAVRLARTGRGLLFLDELGSALLEVAAIARTVGGRRDLVTVVSCDAAARVAAPLCRAEDIPLLGGGTDLRAGFARALRPRPGRTCHRRSGPAS